jgi:hypothetical protein
MITIRQYVNFSWGKKEFSWSKFLCNVNKRIEIKE